MSTLERADFIFYYDPEDDNPNIERYLTEFGASGLDCEVVCAPGEKLRVDFLGLNYYPPKGSGEDGISLVIAAQVCALKAEPKPNRRDRGHRHKALF